MRFGEAIRRLMKSESGQKIAVIAHGTVISTFVAELLEVDPIPVWDSLGVPGLLEIEWPNPSKILTRRNFE